MTEQHAPELFRAIGRLEGRLEEQRRTQDAVLEAVRDLRGQLAQLAEREVGSAAAQDIRLDRVEPAVGRMQRTWAVGWMLSGLGALALAAASLGREKLSATADWLSRMLGP